MERAKFLFIYHAHFVMAPLSSLNNHRTAPFSGAGWRRPAAPRVARLNPQRQAKTQDIMDGRTTVIFREFLVEGGPHPWPLARGQPARDGLTVVAGYGCYLLNICWKLWKCWLSSCLVQLSEPRSYRKESLLHAA